MHWTSTPRNESLGRLAPIVLSIDPTIRIPPQNPRYFLTTGCRLEGIEDVGGRGGAPFITLENVWYHAHLLGREMYTELYPAKQAGAVAGVAGVGGTTIWKEPRWHFDDQYSVDLHARHVTLRNGDLVQSTCVYVRVRERFCDELGIPPWLVEMISLTYRHGHYFWHCYSTATATTATATATAICHCDLPLPLRCH